jgi:hypothetical protein
MKNSHSVKGDSAKTKVERREKPKKAKTASRVSSSDIARRYMELRVLRAQISEAEAS